MYDQDAEVGASMGAEFEPASAGTHDAVLAQVVILEPEHHPKFGLRHQGLLIYQVRETVELEDGTKRRKEVRGYFDLRRGLGSVNHKTGTKLRKWLAGWRGKKFTREELMTYVKPEDGGGGKKLKLKGLETRPCQVMVESATAESSGNEYAKLIGVLPPNKDKDKRLQVVGFTRWEDREATDETAPAPAGAGAFSPSDDDDLPF